MKGGQGPEDEQEEPLQKSNTQGEGNVGNAEEFSRGEVGTKKAVCALEQAADVLAGIGPARLMVSPAVSTIKTALFGINTAF